MSLRMRSLGRMLREERQRHHKATLEILTATRREPVMASRSTKPFGGDR